MRESVLLEHIYRRSADLGASGTPSGGRGIAVGPGDDCAVLDLTAGLTLATVDHLVEGRHYDPRAASIDQIARKAVARSVSDIAAMGGTPRFGLATGCIPAGFSRADELFDRMAHWARHLGCPLVGGDIASSDGPLVLTVTVLGIAHPHRGPVLRSTAAAGDRVCVTGRLGGSLVPPPTGNGGAEPRHLSFTPRVAEGAALCDQLGPALTSMIDLSDGLGRDAGRIAKASAVRFTLQAPCLPLNDGVQGWRNAVADGEDYELLFTVAPSARVPDQVAGTPISMIGEVRQGEGCFVIDQRGAPHEVSELGWEHGA